jgi:nucleotide-binding universal stress UspA family protein
LLKSICSENPYPKHNSARHEKYPDAIDFSENAERALAAAKLIAEKAVTELLILHAYQPYIADVNVTPGNVMPGIGGADFLTMTTELEDEFHKRLEEYAANLIADGYNAKAIWTLGSVQSAIEEAIDDHVPDMIVIGADRYRRFPGQTDRQFGNAYCLELPLPRIGGTAAGRAHEIQEGGVCHTIRI